MAILNNPKESKSVFHNIPWWSLEKEEASKAIAGLLQFWSVRQLWRQKNYIQYGKKYGNLPNMGWYGTTTAQMRHQENAPVWDSRLTFNIIGSCVDALTAKIAANEPTPDYLGSDGDSQTQHQCEQLDKFTIGCFAENKTYQKGLKVFKDSLIWGEGLMKVVPRNDRAFHEHVRPNEIWVDELEASTNDGPRQLHHVYDIDRSVLLARYPGQEEMIDNAGRMAIGIHFIDQSAADLVTVIESWHLPSGPDADDGKFLVSTTLGPLTELEPFTRDHYPFERFCYLPRSFGYWPQGLAEVLSPIQTEINRILWSIQQSLMRAGTFKIHVANGSKIVVDQLDDRIGAVIKSDSPPSYIVPQIVPPELYQQLAQLKTDAYNQAGISQLSATSQKPDGVDSGKAMRAYEDINSARFLPVGKAYERFYVGIAKLTIEAVEDITKAGKKYAVRSPSRKSLEVIDFKDITIGNDEYDIQCFPISSLPNEPAGRLSTVTEMMQGNLITPEEGRDLLGYADLSRSDSLAAAQHKWQEKNLDQIINEHVYNAPDPFDDLLTGRLLAIQYLARGKLQNLDEEAMDLLRQYVQAIDSLQQQAAPPPPVPGPPQANPSPPPVSNLIPNAPQPH